MEQFRDMGIDVDAALERFMNNEELYITFFKKLGQDKTCEKMLFQMEQGNVEQAFNEAHSLKGMIANLSIIPLYTLVCEMVEELRAGKMPDLKLIDEFRDCYGEYIDYANKL